MKRTISELEILNKELEDYSDEKLSEFIVYLGDIYFDVYDGVRYKREAKIIDNKRRLLADCLSLRYFKRFKQKLKRKE